MQINVHDLAHAKGVPTAAREAMLIMQERITQQEAVIAGLVEALELIAHEGGQAEYRIASQALAKAKESRDV